MKTQKALGLKCETNFEKVPYFVVERGKPVDEIPSWFGDVLFVRPCPVKPRHGFLESFKVHRDNLSEAIQDVFKQMEQIGEDGEVIVMPYIDAIYNAIVAPGTITIGRGNAGATSGVNAMTLPFPDLHIIGWDPKWGSPYVELVKDSHWRTTQFRGGPETGNTDDYVVDGYVVEHIYELRSDMDLLEWEKMVRQFPKGTVVFHRGGAVTSHYGVHCVTAGIPYFTTRVPRIGEVLKSEIKQKKRYRNLLKRFRHYVSTIRISYSHVSELVRASIYVLHYFPKMTPQQREMLVPLFAAVWCRVGEALCLGEARHPMVHGHREGCNVRSFQTAGYSRDAIYSRSLENGDIEITLEEAYRCFSQCSWHSQYGGKAWARCAKSILSMIKAPTLSALIKAWNRSINLAHNNGWWMNKVVSKSTFDEIHSPTTAIKAVETIYEVFNPQEIKPVEYAKFGVQWRPLDNRKIRIQCPEFRLERDCMFETLNDFVIEHSEFTLKSTAGTNKMYAPANIFVRNGEVTMEFILKGGVLFPVVLGDISGAFSSNRDLLEAILLGKSCGEINSLIEGV